MSAVRALQRPVSSWVGLLAGMRRNSRGHLSASETYLLPTLKLLHSSSGRPRGTEGTGIYRQSRDVSLLHLLCTHVWKATLGCVSTHGAAGAGGRCRGGCRGRKLGLWGPCGAGPAFQSQGGSCVWLLRGLPDLSYLWEKLKGPRPFSKPHQGHPSSHGNSVIYS